MSQHKEVKDDSSNSDRLYRLKEFKSSSKKFDLPPVRTTITHSMNYAYVIQSINHDFFVRAIIVSNFGKMKLFNKT